jgi:hypothetical protein
VEAAVTAPDQGVAASTTLPASPTPHELVVLPELALLTALQQLLELTTRSLTALYPARPARDDIAWRLRSHDLLAALAAQILELAACLTRATTCYRVAAIDSLYVPDTDDIPF